MTYRDHLRRPVLRLAGCALAAATLGAGCADADQQQPAAVGPSGGLSPNTHTSGRDTTRPQGTGTVPGSMGSPGGFPGSGG